MSSPALGEEQRAPSFSLLASATESFWTTVVLAASGAIAAGFSLILPRVLGPEEYGLFSNVQAVVLFALGFVTLGVADAVPRLVGPGGTGSSTPWTGIVTRVSSRVILPVAGVVAATAGYWYGWPLHVTLCALALLASTGVATLAGGIVRAETSPVLGLLLAQSWRFFSLPVVALVCWFPVRFTAYGALVALALAGVAGAVVGGGAVLRFGGGKVIPPEIARKLRTESRSFVGINASLALLGYLDQLIIPAALGLTALGQYAVTWWLVGTPFLLIQGGTGYALLPRLRRATDEGVISRTLRVQQAWLVGVSCLIAVAAATLLPRLLRSFYGDLYEVSAGLILAMVLCGLLRIAYAIPSSIVGAWGDAAALARLNRWGWPAAGVAAVCAWIGGATLGLTGVALGMAAGLAVRLAIAALLAREIRRARVREGR